MNRWTTLYPTGRRLFGALLVLAATAFATAAQAQMARLFPMGVQRGTIEFTEPPEVRLNGQPERLGPGVRIRNQFNMLALSGTVVGQTYLVNYLRDPAGVIREIWLLTPEEASHMPDGTPVPMGDSRESLYGG